VSARDRKKGQRRGRTSAKRGQRRVEPPSVADIAAAAVRGADELLTIEDPLEAETRRSIDRLNDEIR
jgi:hypothetical protein